MGNHLKKLREQHGLTRAVLAEQLEISNAFVNFIEQGKRLPGKDTLGKYARFFKEDLSYLKDILEKQKLLNAEDTTVRKEAQVLSEPITKLSLLLQKVDNSLLDDLVASFMHQVNDHLIAMTANYNLTDLRDKHKKILSFENDNKEDICIDGFLKLPENNHLFFRFTRSKDSLTLELLQNDRSKFELFEKWNGPHVYSNLCEIMIPQVIEPQRGVSFTWFSPNVTLDGQYKKLLQQKEVSMDSVLFNSGHLAWYIQTRTVLDAG